MDINNDLVFWSARWMIMGDLMVCRACLESQPVDAASEPFAHTWNCSAASDISQYPWRELAGVFSELGKSH
jgi:hypothetical protein